MAAGSVLRNPVRLPQSGGDGSQTGGVWRQWFLVVPAPFLLRQTVMVARHGRRTAASARGAAVDGSSLPRASRASTFLSFVASAGLIQSRFFLSSFCPYVG